MLTKEQIEFLQTLPFLTLRQVLTGLVQDRQLQAAVQVNGMLMLRTRPGEAFEEFTVQVRWHGDDRPWASIPAMPETDASAERLAERLQIWLAWDRTIREIRWTRRGGVQGHYLTNDGATNGILL